MQQEANCRCGAFSHTTAYHDVVDQWRRAAQQERDDLLLRTQMEARILAIRK